tara:strand:+ start:583 stop:1131 length:549 start_codon:yes stop_codon:yes gene_type:complete
MIFVETSFDGLYVVKPKVHEDERGYFMESFKSILFEEKFPTINFIQENESSSSRGVLRGLHFQLPPYEQTKLVRVIKGEVLDVVVDLRKNSQSFGKHYKIKLSEMNKKMLLVPKGFAHGFLVLSESAIFSYKVDNYYAPEYDCGIVYNDKDLNIDWGNNHNDIKLSKKDRNLQKFNNFISPF